MSEKNKLYLKSPCNHKKDIKENFCFRCGALLYDEVK